MDQNAFHPTPSDFIGQKSDGMTHDTIFHPTCRIRHFVGSCVTDISSSYHHTKKIRYRPILVLHDVKNQRALAKRNKGLGSLSQIIKMVIGLPILKSYVNSRLYKMNKHDDTMIQKHFKMSCKKGKI